jgi:Tol biopolymer transport system component
MASHYTTQCAPPRYWVMELARGIGTRITFNGAFDPRWSPDGRHVYSVSQGGICRKSADGAGEEELLLKDAPGARLQSVSPDGRYLLFGSGRLTLLPLAGERKPQTFLQDDSALFNAAFSPDGRWIAYESEASGRREIYIQGFPSPQGKWLVSAAGGQFAAWRADGRELYWTGLDLMLTAASVDFQSFGKKLGRPEPLFRLSASRPAFAPSRDGRRFLVQEQEDDTVDPPMVLVQHWAAALRK